jgi:(1->4)-alpha-D-glucan 1-alpha-D-glucosylmutase
MTEYRMLLHRLARHAGIATGWRDVWGQRHEVSPETLAAVLRAMDLPAGCATEAHATLKACRRAQAGLPQALVLDAGAVIVPLPRGFDARDWTLELESGDRHRGRSRSDEASVTLPVALPEGYHRLRFEHGEPDEICLIATPACCHLPPVHGERRWGLAIQLYSLRSERQWGIGDFTDLAALSAGVAAAGGALVGVNPLHALFPAVPERISPYSPSSRLFLNPLYLDIAAIPDFTETETLRVADETNRRALAALSSTPLIDYPAVAKMKMAAFKVLWRSFRSRHLNGQDSARGCAFRQFQAAGGEVLERFARFHALQAHLAADHGPDWRDWPAAFRDPARPEVAQFAVEHGDEIEQHHYLQWEAERQLATAADGLPIGLYRDLAIGTDSGGADNWGNASHYLTGVSVGAPPDLLNSQGQNWGLTGLSPASLKSDGYASFIALLRANMRHAGGLRIDHVMGLKQLYVIPEGRPPAQGAYIRYPFRELVRILALESRRHHCLVVGEDLGTVPRGFRPIMRRAGILSCRVLPFERRGDGRFRAPRAYPEMAAASAGTHDLPPLKAWWLGSDIRLRDAAGQYPAAGTRQREEVARDRDRRNLLAALRREKLLSPVEAEALLPAQGPPAFHEALTAAVHRYLAATPARLMLFQAEDLLACDQMVNLPGTVGEHPNWRRRLAASIPELLSHLG